jgi:hypothetical protein
VQTTTTSKDIASDTQQSTEKGFHESSGFVSFSVVVLCLLGLIVFLVARNGKNSADKAADKALARHLERLPENIDVHLKARDPRTQPTLEEYEDDSSWLDSRNQESNIAGLTSIDRRAAWGQSHSEAGRRVPPIGGPAMWLPEAEEYLTTEAVSPTPVRLQSPTYILANADSPLSPLPRNPDLSYLEEISETMDTVDTAYTADDHMELFEAIGLLRSGFLPPTEAEESEAHYELCRKNSDQQHEPHDN